MTIFFHSFKNIYLSFQKWFDLLKHIYFPKSCHLIFQFSEIVTCSSSHIKPFFPVLVEKPYFIYFSSPVLLQDGKLFKSEMG